jgi:predicted phosphodiesterase
MRIAVVSDIHGNLTAFDAVLRDLEQTSPDLIFHAGDLADGGSNPREIADKIRYLGWQGVVGNADEMLFRPASLQAFAAQVPQMNPLLPLIEAIAAWTREQLGEDRMRWLSGLPMTRIEGPLTLVHASPASCWRAPPNDEEFSSLGTPVAVYAHLHRPSVRKFGLTTIVNTGSVSLSYDGDPRASYLLLTDSTPEIRRVAYDVAKEEKALLSSCVPHARWIATMLKSASFEAP